MPPRSARAFWSKDLGFAIDTSRQLSDCPRNWSRHKNEATAEFLEQSARLPHLQGAPVASWVVSRLFEMTKGNLEIDETELLHNDGGVICLKWEIFSRSFNPRGFLDLFCYSNRISLLAYVPEGIDPELVISAFLDALLADPPNLRKCRIAVIDTDPPNAPGTRGKRYVFGWDGQRFLGSRDYE